MLEMCFNCDYCEEQNGDYFCTNSESEYVGDYVEKEFSCQMGRRKMNEGCVTEKRCFI